MKAKCPLCESGCEHCSNGIIDCEMADGEWIYRVCLNDECQMINAGSVVDVTAVLLKADPCVFCGSPTKWMAELDVPANAK